MIRVSSTSTPFVTLSLYCKNPSSRTIIFQVLSIGQIQISILKVISMAGIFSRVMSRKQTIKAPPSPPSEDEDTLIDAQEPEAVEKEPLTFAERGITDHATILLE